MYDLKMLVEMQNELFKALEPYFEQLGLKLYVDRIVIEPEGCNGKCVEFVWRLECETKEICDEVKKKIIEQQGEHQGVGIGVT